VIGFCPMGDDLQIWRAAIGLFNCRSFLNINKVKVKFMVSLELLRILLKLAKILILLLSLTKKYICNISCVVVVLLLLLRAGDVETNPGPVSGVEGCLSILHCNIRSIRHKLDYIRDSFIDFDILCFTETHLDETVLDETLILSNFNSDYRKDRTCHGGGILVYVSDSLIHNRMPELEQFCPESVWIKIRTKHETYLVGTFYSPKTSDSDFFNNFNRNIDKALDLTRNVVILGDLNEDLLNLNNHKLKDVLLTNSLVNTIEEPTRGNALLDPIIIPSDMSFANTGTLINPREISDHSATYIILPFS
jgi:exonuclease III